MHIHLATLKFCVALIYAKYSIQDRAHRDDLGKVDY